MTMRTGNIGEICNLEVLAEELTDISKVMGFERSIEAANRK